jgi:hypothetical protein
MNAIPNRRGLLLRVLTAGAAATVAAIPAIAARRTARSGPGPRGGPQSHMGAPIRGFLDAR